MVATRERIRMSDEEIAAFLAEPHKLALATLNADGSVHLVTMYYAVFDGRLGFWTYRTSQKARNLQRDPRVTCLAETGEGYDQLRGVQIQGTVQRVEDAARIRAMGAAIYSRYVPGFSAELEGYLEQQAAKRWAYLVEPTKTATWDHRKLAAATTAGA